MGRDVAEAYPVARDTFAEADDLLGFAPVRRVLQRAGRRAGANRRDAAGPVRDVRSPSCGPCSRCCLSARPAFGAGHSLGEITALAAAGALSFRGWCAAGARAWAVDERGGRDNARRDGGAARPGRARGARGVCGGQRRNGRRAGAGERQLPRPGRDFRRCGGRGCRHCTGQGGRCAARDQAGSKHRLAFAADGRSRTRQFAEALAATPFAELAYPMLRQCHGRAARRRQRPFARN